MALYLLFLGDFSAFPPFSYAKNDRFTAASGAAVNDVADRRCRQQGCHIGGRCGAFCFIQLCAVAVCGVCLRLALYLRLIEFGDRVAAGTAGTGAVSAAGCRAGCCRSICRRRWQLRYLRLHFLNLLIHHLLLRLTRSGAGLSVDRGQLLLQSLQLLLKSSPLRAAIAGARGAGNQSADR